ncbi:hypothetical protein E4U43_001131 [Claviceps pusilla]|uniref:Uncharacterized protein n=1 Tax=Claviceps pusilla TaxID=123648 RepID=A0A9P7SX44_9HYPO|nr:hypothetical protein E4U43_001131 [Claviceps pusilla]
MDLRRAWDEGLGELANGSSRLQASGTSGFQKTVPAAKAAATCDVRRTMYVVAHLDELPGRHTVECRAQ